MSKGQDYKINPDSILILAGFLIAVFLLYNFKPVRVRCYTVLSYIYSIEAFIIMKYDEANVLRKIGDYTNKASINQIKKLNIETLEKILDGFVARNRIRLFLTSLIPISLCLYVLYTFRKDYPFFRGKIDLKSYIIEKYDLKEIVKEKNVRKIYSILQEKKAKANIPINVVARLFPKDSKERTFIYKGSDEYKLEEIKIQ